MNDTLSTCVFCLPESVSNELKQIAQDGFIYGAELSTGLCVSIGLIVVVLYLINKGAGR